MTYPDMEDNWHAEELDAIRSVMTFGAADYDRIFGTEDELFDPIGTAMRRHCTSASDGATIVNLAPERPTPPGGEPGGVAGEDPMKTESTGPVPTSIAKRQSRKTRKPIVSDLCMCQFFRQGRWYTCTLPRLHRSACSDSPPPSAA
jgi:hypothetical protein